MMRKRRWRSFSCACSVVKRSGQLDGSSTICAKITARAAARGLRAHHRCSVLGCPCRIDFSRADALLMASSGSATSMSFLAGRTALTACRLSGELFLVLVHSVVLGRAVRRPAVLAHVQQLGRSAPMLSCHG